MNIYVEPRVRAELLTESSYFSFVQTWKDGKQWDTYSYLTFNKMLFIQYFLNSFSEKEILLLHTKVDLVVTLGGDGTVLWVCAFKLTEPVFEMTLDSEIDLEHYRINFR